MIGKPEWFQRRKFGGWGITPKTWQGWLYIAIFLLPIIAFQTIYQGAEEIKFGVTIVWVGLLLIDALDIMRKLNKDEREERHEAIAERNAAWFMVVILTIGMGYDIITHALVQEFYINPFIAIALFGAVVVKGISNYWLEKKE